MSGASVRESVDLGAVRRGRRLGEHELLRLVDRAPDVIFRYRLSPPGYEFVSRAITRLTGLAPEELYADPSSALKLVHHDDRAIAYDLLARGASRAPVIIRWVRKDGSTVWVEQRTTSVFNSAHELVAIEGIAREIDDPTFGSRSSVRIRGDLRIDLDRGRVLLGGRDVRLTPSEFRLLVLLTDQPGRIVSRATIMEALGSSVHEGTGRSCEVHISKLRGKLEEGSDGAPHIETVRSKGYRFIPHG